MAEFNPYGSGNILDSRNLPDYKNWEDSGYGDLFYYIRGDSRVSSVNAFNEYFFTSHGNHIYYINKNYSTARPLEGTYSPQSWQPDTQYERGDVVKPVTYNGYVYVCCNNTNEEDMTFGSGSTEPEWVEDTSTIIIDNEVHWKGVGTLEAEGNSAKDLQARCLAVYKDFLFMGNTVEDGNNHPSRVRWSQWQNPRMWHNNEDGSGLSGYVDLNDLSGQIMNMKTLGDTLYIYKNDSIIAITYTGAEDLTFSKEVVTTRAGLIAQDAIVEMPHYHLFVGQDNIYIFDGNTCMPIGDPIKQWFFEQLDNTRVYRMFGYYEKETDDVIIAFSSIKNKSRIIGGKVAEDCDLALIYNATYRTWSVRQIYMTAAGKYRTTSDKMIDDINVPFDQLNDVQIDGALYTKNANITLAGDQFGYFYTCGGYIDNTHGNTSGAYDGQVVSKTHHMDAPDRIKRLLRIQFHIETQSDYGLYVQVGTSWNAETPMEWGERQYLNLNKPVPWYSHHIAPFIDVDLSARYFQLRFGTDGANQPFKILGYTLFYQIRSNE